MKQNPRTWRGLSGRQTKRKNPKKALMGLARGEIELAASGQQMKKMLGDCHENTDFRNATPAHKGWKEKKFESWNRREISPEHRKTLYMTSWDNFAYTQISLNQKKSKNS